MDTFPGISGDRLVVSIDDRPLLFVDAIDHALTQVRQGEAIVEDTWSFDLNARIAKSCLMQDFDVRADEIRNPDAKVVLPMTVDETEAALCSYGVAPERTTSEQQQVNQLLIAIDGLKAQMER